MSRVVIGICAGCLLLFTGCTSIRSIMLHRDESNVGWQQTRHLPGVPITLKVPTHLQLAIVEKHYLTEVQAGDIRRIERISLPVPVRTFHHEFIRTEKIFTVDFKRPAAGTMKLTVDFQDEEQYFKKIEHEVVDETIKDVTGLLKAVAPGGLFGAPASREAGDPWIEVIESTVAVEIFEIDDPLFEMKVSAFLQCHLNKAHDAWVMPPGVSDIRRLPLIDDHTGAEELCPGSACINGPFGTNSSELLPAPSIPPVRSGNSAF